MEGEVAGAWRFENDRVELDPFGRLDASAKGALAEEGDRLAELHR